MRKRNNSKRLNMKREIWVLFFFSHKMLQKGCIKFFLLLSLFFPCYIHYKNICARFKIALAFIYIKSWLNANHFHIIRLSLQLFTNKFAKSFSLIRIVYMLKEKQEHNLTSCVDMSHAAKNKYNQIQFIRCPRNFTLHIPRMQICFLFCNYSQTSMIFIIFYCNKIKAAADKKGRA